MNDWTMIQAPRKRNPVLKFFPHRWIQRDSNPVDLDFQLAIIQRSWPRPKLRKSMKTILHTSLEEIQDQGVQDTIQDLCRLRNWHPDHYPEHSLFNFLEVLMKEDPSALSVDRLAAPLVVHKKIGKLQDHAIYAVCKELNNGDTLEGLANTTLISFLKKRFSYVRNKTENRDAFSEIDIDVRTILQRRKNGDL